MELSVAAANLLYAFAGMLLMLFGVWLFDKMKPRVDFSTEVVKGNVAMAIIIGAFFLSLAYFIGRSLN